jgi:hypothetical protein
MNTTGKKVYMSPKRQKMEKKRENKNEQREIENKNKAIYTGPVARNQSKPPKSSSPQKKYEVVPEDLSAFII